MMMMMMMMMMMIMKTTTTTTIIIIIFYGNYTRDSLRREARASECSLQRAREGTPPYPTCYARHMMRAVSDVM